MALCHITGLKIEELAAHGNSSIRSICELEFGHLHKYIVGWNGVRNDDMEVCEGTVAIRGDRLLNFFEDSLKKPYSNLYDALEREEHSPPPTPSRIEA